MLEAGLIDCLRHQTRGIADLQGGFGGRGVVAGLWQHYPADTGVLLRVTVKLITGSERVIRTDLVVEARSDVGASPWVGNDLTQAQYRRVHDRDFIDVAPLHVQEE